LKGWKKRPPSGEQPQYSLFESLPPQLPPRRMPVSVAPPDETSPAPGDRIQRAFAQFHRDNPQVYEKLVFLAYKVRATGREKYGVGSLFERLRWHYHIEMNKRDDEFKLNNNFRSRYARMIMQTEPDLVDFFNLRVLAINRNGKSK
jgi:hypothetical protein